MNNTNTQQGLKPGALLRHNTYRIERILGQGGFGITYLATDLNLDRLVAIKEFFPKDYCDRDSTTSHVTLGTQSASEFVNKLKAKFLKEARNIAKFDHPGIIKIHAAFEENNTAYYVMDYIEGESLSEMVKRHGPLPESKAIEYITKAGNALEYVHSQNINHLDIKPANIMIRRSDDNPILIDFGLSKQYDSSGNQTSATPVGRSHGFAPMEQYNDGGVKEFSPQTDLYSLAATLYYILSGVTPPQATKLIEDELTFPPSIPSNLIGPIAKAMSSRRSQRHESVSEFVNAIGRLNNSQDKKDILTEETRITTEINNLSNDDNAGKASITKIKESPRKDSGLTRKWIWILISVCAIVVISILIFPVIFNDDKKTDNHNADNIENNDTIQQVSNMDNGVSGNDDVLDRNDTQNQIVSNTENQSQDSRQSSELTPVGKDTKTEGEKDNKPKKETEGNNDNQDKQEQLKKAIKDGVMGSGQITMLAMHEHYAPAYLHYAKLLIQQGQTKDARDYLKLSIKEGVNVSECNELLEILNE